MREETKKWNGALRKTKRRKPRKAASVSMNQDKALRVIDPRIKESRLLHPHLRMAMLDQLLEESLQTIKSLELDVWLQELSKAAVEPDRKKMIKRILAFKEGIQGTAVARAKVIGVANQTLREMRSLVVKEVPKRKKQGEEDVMDLIEHAESESEVAGLAMASLKRLADRGLLSKQILQMAKEQLGDEIVAPIHVDVEPEPEKTPAHVDL